MEPWLAWLILLVLFVAPLVHVAVSPRGGPFLPPPGTRCPFGPRTGWLVMVLLLGPIGWLLYMRRRRPGMPKPSA
ncbi:MAG: hypothetical protein FJX35_10885 [Alphaproteobacteria bacterium]|nr:hypothetical protein [Alphaproteobacteria bacterium]